MKARSATLPLRLYRNAAAAAGVVAPLWLNYRVTKGKEDPSRLAERRGYASAERPFGPLIWVHGASVGELVSVLPLVERLDQRGFTVLLTSGTLTSGRIAQRRAPERVVHQFVPLDAPAFIRRFLDHWQPDLVLLAESELWPNLLSDLDKRGTPVVLVNGRLSPRSARRWGKLKSSARALLSGVDLCLAQSDEDGKRFRALGTPRIEVAGNLKFDVPAPPADPELLADLAAIIGGRPVFLAASTHGGEDEMILQAHQTVAAQVPDLLTIIAPRHPERGDEVDQLAADMGLASHQRSREEEPDGNCDVYVADTIGELGLFYRLAPVVFMGGSLIEHGGQNPIEAAKLGAAVLHGPHVWNFAAIYARLDQQGGAIPVDDAASLASCVLSLLKDEPSRLTIARNAHGTVEALGGALDRTLAAIEPYLIQIRLSRRA